MRLMVIVAMASMSLATPASASIYKFDITGTISAPHAANGNFDPIAAPASSLAEGAPFVLSAIFDTVRFTVDDLYDFDPSINIYKGYFDIVSLNVGNFSFSEAENFGTFQLWNGFINGSQQVDSFTFSTGGNVAPGLSPFDFGGQSSFVAFNFYAFDFSSTARSSDLLGEISSLSGFNSISASSGFVADDRTVVSYSINGLNATLTRLNAVPEPETWMMMIVGFGVIGFAMRRFRRGSQNLPVSKLQTQ